MLSLAWHDKSAEVPRSLWDACFSPPRGGLFWYRALEEGRLTEQFTFQFGVLRQDEIAIGIVPTFLFDLPLDLVIPPPIARFVMPLARGPLRRMAFQRTLFVGNVAGEEGRLGLRENHALESIATFVHHELRARARALKAPMLVWKDFSETDRPALDEALKTNRAFRMVSYPSTVIPLVRGGYAAFLTTLRSDRRWKIRDKLRRGARKIAVTTTVVGRPGQRDLDEIFELFWKTYVRGKTKFERLTPEWFRAIAACDESTFLIQRDVESGRMLAFMLLLNLGQRVVNQFIGIDYESATGAFLYFRLFAAAYDWACTTDATVMQSGQNGYTAKLDLGHELVPLWNFCEHRNAVVNWIYRRLAAQISWDTLDDQLNGYLKAHPGARPTV